MSHHTFQHYIFDIVLPSEPSLNYQNAPEIMLRDLSRQVQDSTPTHSSPALITLNSLPIDPWPLVSSRKFSNLLANFMSQFVCMCVLWAVDVSQKM